MSGISSNETDVFRGYKLRQQLLGKYFDRAKAAGLNPEALSFPTENEQGYAHRRQANLRIYAYSNRLVTQIHTLGVNSSAVFALFDQGGCLLKLSGRSTALARANSSGICKHTMWTLNGIGPNAVSVGLAENQTLSSVGTENFLAALHNFAIYFSPVTVLDDSPPYRQTKYGGVAMIVPLEQQNPDYLINIFTIANDLALHIHSSDVLYRVYEETGAGLLFFDVNMYNGKVTTLYHNKKIFDIFNIPPEDLYFQSADTLLDPLPQNPQFWSILEQQETVAERELTLRIRGKDVNCIVTTYQYNQPSLNTRGMHCFITTPENISHQVSSKMGNSAILTFEHVIGDSPNLQAAVQKCKLLAHTDSNVMLLGESGVGKDIFAQSIHNASSRRNHPFIAVNCGALPRDLIASELFGYDSGAFTGARRQGNLGKFELANGGTIFLDEIGELPLDLQASLLRVVEQKQFMRLGGSKMIQIDVKIISATNVDISALIEQNHFRADLYYRLSTMRATIPPLRERGRDVILLAQYFIQVISARIGRVQAMEITEAAKALLMKLPWRGNVRELQNLIEAIVQLYPGPILDADHILKNMDTPHAESASWPPLENVPAQAHKKRLSLTAETITETIKACGGNRSEAADMLGIDRKTLYRHMKRLGL